MKLDTGKPNLLLWGLIFISAGLHLMLLMHIAGLYHSGTPLYIELDLRTIAKPIQRNVPRPQDSLDSRALPEVFDPLKVPGEKLFQDDFKAMPPLESLSSKNLPEAAHLPEIPEIKGIDIATWEGEAKKPAPYEGEAPKQAPDEGDVTETEKNTGSEAAYINQVGQMISAKAEGLYRKKAKKRQMQGRTVVMVVIGDSGVIVTTRVAESSNQRMLDQIALKAVEDASPFPKPPKGAFTLYIPINFKLI
jgi:protein TonB